MRGSLTLLLLVIAVGAGTWKILQLSAANRELHRQNRRYASVAASHERRRVSLERSLRRGSPAPAFTLLGLDGEAVRVDPPRERAPLHLLFLDAGMNPAGNSGDRLEALLQNYSSEFRRFEPRARTLILTARGYEETRAILAGRSLPYPVGVHAALLYVAYGFLDSPGYVSIMDGRVREKWRLPYRGDRLPLD